MVGGLTAPPDDETPGKKGKRKRPAGKAVGGKRGRRTEEEQECEGEGEDQPAPPDV